jgi:hypothetical protein
MAANAANPIEALNINAYTRCATVISHSFSIITLIIQYSLYRHPPAQIPDKPGEIPLIVHFPDGCQACWQQHHHARRFFLQPSACLVLNGSLHPVLEPSDSFAQKEKAANCSFFFPAPDVPVMH